MFQNLSAAFEVRYSKPKHTKSKIKSFIIQSCNSHLTVLTILFPIPVKYLVGIVFHQRHFVPFYTNI